MNNKLLWGGIASLLLLMSTVTTVSAKSDDNIGGSYTKADKEYYLTDAEVAFIRPGLVVEIMDVTIPSDLQTEVTFKLTDPAGLPLDIEGIYTPGSITPRFALSYIPVGEEAYVSYITREQTSPITGDTATQASDETNGTITDMGEGVYSYKFSTVLPEDYPMDATTTLGMQVRRNLDEWDLGQQVENELFHFVPSGSGTAQPRDMTTTTTCNRCHDPLSIHGGWRNEVEMCVLCHNPTQSIDPDTGDSVDMGYMTHKIHYGANLANGYTIIGYGQGVHDYSHVEYPDQAFECEACHTGGTPTSDFPLVANPNPAPVCDGSGKSITEVSWGDAGGIEIRLREADGKLFARSFKADSAATGKWVTDGMPIFMVGVDSGEEIAQIAVDNSVLGCVGTEPGTFRGTAGEQHTAWMTNPSRVACGSCHDDVDFTSGEEHPIQETDDSCNVCHKATGGEFDLSVAGAHLPEYKSSQLGGFLVEIASVRNTGPGESPIVTFALRNKFGYIDPADIDRLRFNLSGPNDDFDFYVQENVAGAMVANGNSWDFQFSAKLPTDAMGSYSLGVEGRLNATLVDGRGDEIETEAQMQNFIEPIAVTADMPMSRRQVVDDGLCEDCHVNLSLHGSNRHDADGYCQTCHMPGATDAPVRPEDAGDPQSIDFRYMIHKIHRGVDAENGYTVYGYRSSFHDFSHVEYPGDLRNCDACHVDDSYQLPLPAGTLEVTTPYEAWTPMLPETASCLSCHDGESTAVHADANTTDLGESCSTCHGEGKTYSVDAVHAR